MTELVEEIKVIAEEKKRVALEDKDFKKVDELQVKLEETIEKLKEAYASMDNTTVARQLLDKVCTIDPTLKNAMMDKPTEAYVMDILSKNFDKIVKNHPHLVDDIQRRVVEYHTNRGTTGDIADFVQIIEWYSMCLEDKPFEYFDPNEKYYGLRMSEVINMFLIAKHQC